MNRTLGVGIVCLLLSVPVMAADDAGPEPGALREFSKDLVEKCLNRKHGEMLRCMKEGIGAAAEDTGVAGGEVESVTLWEAPEEARDERNPYPRDEESVRKGRAFYRVQCSQCHGRTGHGDGPAAADFGRDIADLSDPRTQSRTDGELMWKITEGGWPMPAFGYQDEWGRDDLWHVINFLRTLRFDAGS